MGFVLMKWSFTKTFKICILIILCMCFCLLEINGANEDKKVNKITYYCNIYNAEYWKNRNYLDSDAASGNGYVYYSFSYILDGTLCMYEATKDLEYVEQVLDWAEVMVSNASVIDKNGNYNWKGTWVSPHTGTPISYQLWDFQGSTELARLSRIIKLNPSLNAIYGMRATAIYNFVKDHIVDKWLFKRNSLSWFYDDVKQQKQPLNDKTVLLMRILVDLYLAGGDSKYKGIVTKLAESFKTRFQPYKGALIWDFGIKWPKGYGGCSMDTMHANRYPYTVIDLYKAGIVFTIDDVQGLANLLVKVIWNQSFDSPCFTNYIDGTNDCFKDSGPGNNVRGPWNNGLIYSGWIGLGEFDSKVQAIGDAVLKAILAGKRNPSLDYMNTVYGKIELAGHQAKNFMISNN